MTGFIIALFLPWALGAAWLYLLWKSANLAMLLGYGYIIGLGAVTVLIRLWHSMGFSFAFWSMAGVILLLAVLPLMLRRALIKPSAAANNQPVSRPSSHKSPSQLLSSRILAWAQNFLFLLLAVMLIARFSTLLFDTITRPLFAWDAWMNFAPKAKIWFELLDLRPFISPENWLRAENPDAYTLGNPQSWSYPISVPLIMFWHALGMDAWRDDWIKIPWVICGIALALAVYGQLRQFRVSRHWAMLCVYFLLSMPYINIHMLLGGYADLWLGTTICLSFLVFLRWRESRHWQDFLIMLLLLLLGMSIKHPGVLWGGLLIFCVVLDQMRKWLFWSFLGFCIAALGAVFSIGIDLQLPYVGRIALSANEVVIPYRGSYIIEFSNISKALAQSLFLQPNWHLLWYAAVLLLAAGLATARMRFHHVVPAFYIASSMAALLFIFYFVPRYSHEALSMVTLNRSLLHIAPALFVFLAWWWLAPPSPDGQDQDRERINPELPTP